MSITRSIAKFFRASDYSGSLSSITNQLDDALGIESIAGVKVSKRAALGVAAFYRGVNVIARYTAKCPLITYKHLQPKGKERAKDHPAYALLRRQANPQMTAFTLKQVATGHVVMHGNAYIYVRRDRSGRPLELWPLLPDRTWPIRVNGELWYITHVNKFAGEQVGAGETNEQVKIPAANVIHLKGLGYDGLVGYNVIRYAAATLGLAIANRDFGATFYERGGANRVVLETPKTLSEPAANRIIAGWKSMTQGKENWWRTAILEEETKAHVLSVSAKDAQMVDAMKFTNKEIANWMNLPEHMVNGDGRTAFASLEQENQRFLDDAIDPWFCTWEAECYARLLTEEERSADSHEIEFLRQALVRTNMAERYAAYNIAKQNGVINADEWRDLENMNPLPDGQGQMYLVPLNMIPAADAGKPRDDKQPTDDEDPDDVDAEDEEEEEEEAKKKKQNSRRASRRDVLLESAAREVLVDAVRRMAKRLGVAARTQAKNPKTFGEWRETFAGLHETVIRSALRPGLAVMTSARSETRDREQLAGEAAAALCGELRSIVDRLYDTATAEELAAAVDRELAAAEPTWPELIVAKLFPS